MKPGDTPKYVSEKSDHPRKIVKNVPLIVQKRLSSISSNQEVFMDAAPPYQQALNKAGYNHILVYEEDALNNNNDDEDNNNDEDDRCTGCREGASPTPVRNLQPDGC